MRSNELYVNNLLPVEVIYVSTVIAEQGYREKIAVQVRVTVKHVGQGLIPFENRLVSK